MNLEKKKGRKNENGENGKIKLFHRRDGRLENVEARDTIFRNLRLRRYRVSIFVHAHIPERDLVRSCCFNNIID